MQLLRPRDWKKVFGCRGHATNLNFDDDAADFDLYPVLGHHIFDKKNILAASWTPQELTSDQSDGENEDLPSILGLRYSSKLSAVEKLQWLRSQLIGGKLEFVTPFGKRQLLYMDQAASGRGLLFIEDYIVRRVLPIYGNTHTEDSFVGKGISSIVRTSARYIKKQLGGTSNDALLFCGSGCTAALKRLQEVMGIAIPSILRSRVLATLTHDERWVVFTGPYEHHSNLLSWRQSLAEVVEIPADSDGSIDVAALESALKSPLYRSSRLILGSFSACSNVTGLMTDTRAISRLLHEHGAFACFDFAASAAHVHIDMRSSEKDGYDALVLSPHKLTGGPGTPGILLMTKVLYMLGKNPPSTCGGGTVAYVNGFNEKDTLYYDNIEEREDAGTPPIMQKIRCALAFSVKDYMGHELIEHREAALIKKAIKRLTANANIRILGNTTVKRAAILSFVVMTTENGNETLRRASTESGRGADVGGGKPLHGRFVAKLLNDLFGIQARGGCACAGPYGHELMGVGQKLSLELRAAIQKGYAGLKPGWARLSFCYEMTEEEVEYALAAIEVVGKYGQRFLALYTLDWRTGDWTFTQTTTDLPPPASPLSDGDPVIRHDNIHVARPASPRHDRTTGAARRKFRHCLSTAKAIAHLLPKFPPPRPLPRDIPDALLLFRV